MCGKQYAEQHLTDFVFDGIIIRPVKQKHFYCSTVLGEEHKTISSTFFRAYRLKIVKFVLLIRSTDASEPIYTRIRSRRESFRIRRFKIIASGRTKH